MILRGTSALLRFTPGTAADIEATASWIDYDPDGSPATDRFTPDSDVYASNTGTSATTVVPSPGAADIRRNVLEITIKNNHASQSSVITVEWTDGTDTVELLAPTLLAGETLEYRESHGWVHYDANHGPYPSVGNAATQSDQETASALDRYVSPGTQQYHPSAAKVWAEIQSNTTTLLASYNATSVTDGAVGITTLTIATDFSSANWACQVSRSEDDLTLVYSCTYNAKAAGSVEIRSVVEAGSGSDPTSSSGNASTSVVGYGDQ